MHYQKIDQFNINKKNKSMIELAVAICIGLCLFRCCCGR